MTSFLDLVTFSTRIEKPWSHTATLYLQKGCLTSDWRREAEDIVAMKMEVSSAVAPDTRGEAMPPAWHSGLCDGVLDCPVCQPACIAPVQALLPGLEELWECGQRGVLLLTGLLGSQEAQVVTAMRVLVGEHHTWVEEFIRMVGSDVWSHSENWSRGVSVVGHIVPRSSRWTEELLSSSPSTTSQRYRPVSFSWSSVITRAASPGKSRLSRTRPLTNQEADIMWVNFQQSYSHW